MNVRSYRFMERARLIIPLRTPRGSMCVKAIQEVPPNQDTSQPQNREIRCHERRSSASHDDHDGDHGEATVREEVFSDGHTA